MFGSSWEDGTATIVETRVTSVETSQSPASHEYVADVEVPGKPPFRTTMKDPSFAVANFLSPRPGQVMRAKIDVKRQKAKFDKSDPQFKKSSENVAAVIQTRLEERKAEGHRPPADPTARLKHLAELKERGAISDAEYEQLRKAVAEGG